MAKRKRCFSGIGGQAVLEGVMMKNKDLYAVAVRKSDGTIIVDKQHYDGVLHGNALSKIPFVRGVFNFIDSMVLGMRTLNYSVSFYEEEEPEKADETDDTEVAETAETAEAAESTETVEAAEGTEMAETAEAAEGTETAEAAESIEAGEAKAAESETESGKGEKSTKGKKSGKKEKSKKEEKSGKLFGEKGEAIFMGITTVISMAISIGIFMILPYYISSLFEKYIRNASLIAILEGVIRILIFLLYITVISLMKDIRRLYQYHGAEHKCINCIERGRPLTVGNVMRSSRLHKRCGTSFLLFVMIVSIILFFFIRVDNPIQKVGLRILLIPVIAGISYEIIRLAGKSNNILVKILSAPGMLLQRMTTREPDREMVEVAIASVEAVFDWKAFLKENYGYKDEDTDEKA